MKDNLQFDVSDKDDSIEAKLLHERLRDHVEEEVGPSHRRALTVLARTKDGVVGGARGYSHWDWLYISHLWVATSARSQGLGGKLIKEIIKEAKTRDCEGLYIDTFSPRARDFYVREGFEIMGQIAGFPRGHDRFFLLRRLK